MAVRSVGDPGLGPGCWRLRTAEEVLVNELTVGLGNQHLDD
jgi:hypothetical protein